MRAAGRLYISDVSPEGAEQPQTGLKDGDGHSPLMNAAGTGQNYHIVLVPP